VSTFAETQIYFHAGYGISHKIAKHVLASVGVGVNAQRYSLKPYRAYGIGCDAGACVDFNSIGLKTGVICENITTSYMKWSEDYSEKALPHIRFGVGWYKEIPYLYGRFQIQFKTLDLLANEGVNADSSYDSSGISIVKPVTRHFTKDPVYFFYNGIYGMEYSIRNVFALRAGIIIGDSYDVNSTGSRFTFGCGVNLMRRKLSVDFSYLTHELAGTYHIGMTYRWQGFSR